MTDLYMEAKLRHMQGLKEANIRRLLKSARATSDCTRAALPDRLLAWFGVQLRVSSPQAQMGCK
jgi:hypothetical protein